jgi:hypothetical protein
MRRGRNWNRNVKKKKHLNRQRATCEKPWLNQLLRSRQLKLLIKRSRRRLNANSSSRRKQRKRKERRRKTKNF